MSGKSATRSDGAGAALQFDADVVVHGPTNRLGRFGFGDFPLTCLLMPAASTRLARAYPRSLADWPLYDQMVEKRS